MKTFYKFLVCLLIAAYGLFNQNTATAQCTNASSFGSAVAPTGAAAVTISTCSFQSEYSTITSVVAGNRYVVTASAAGTHITMRFSTPAGVVVAAGVTPLQFTAPCAGTYYAHWNTNAACGTASTCITTTIACSSCGAAASQCTNASSFGSAAAPASGTTTISTCSFLSEYSTVTGVVASTVYRATVSTAGSFITVHQGSSGGPVIASGRTPLIFTSTVAGSYYMHWNTNNTCGTASSCVTTTIGFVGASPCAPPPAGCTFASSFGSATLPGSNVLTTISGCSFAGEYSTINGAVAGTTLQFTFSNSGTGAYVTVHSGTPSGPIIAAGPSPLSFANTFTGTLYAHWSLNSACGTDGSCHTTTVQCTSCPAPGAINDFCTGAITIACGGSISSTTVGNNTDANACGGAASPGVWYQITPAASGNVTLSLCTGTTYDSRLSVYSGTCAAPVMVACNDDFCGAASEVTFAAVGGTNYKILVNGFSSGSGPFTLTATCAGAFDPCTAISPISACNVPVTTVIASGAGAYTNGPFAPPGKEKIFTFTPTVTGNYFISQTANTTGTWIDYFFKPQSSGCNSTGWTFVQDLLPAVITSTNSMAMTAGVPYYVYIDPENTVGGTVTFQLNCIVAAPVNDQCTAVSPLPLAPGSPLTFTGTTVGATTTNDGSFTAFPTVWHAFTLSACADVELNYCATSPAFGDVWINLGTACPAFSFVNAASWTQSCPGGGSNWIVQYTALPAGTYYIPVLGNEAGFVVPGPYSLTVTASACAPPPANDLCGGAIAIPCGGTVTGNTSIGYTPDANACGGAASNGAWYTITPTVNSLVTLSMCGSSYDTRLSVYTGTCGSLSLIPGACNDDFCGLQSQLNNIVMSAGVTYYILVNGFSANNGAFTLTATCTPSDCSGQPNPGATVSSVANPVCGAFTLSFANSIPGTNLTYQWESSPDNLTWTPISGATNATYTTGQPATTWYRCVVTCPSNPVGISTPLQVVSNPNFMACYCIPSVSCTFPDIISNVTFAGINRNSACDNPTGGYSVYNTPNPVVLMGVSTPLSVTTSGDVEGIAVWIDYNHSGSFEPAEAVMNGYLATNPATYTASVVIPTSASAGQTMMRVRCSYAGNALPAGPCANYTFGETEDYWIQIVPPNATSNSPVCEGDSLKLFAPTSGVSFSWTTTAGNAFTSTDQNPFIPNSDPGDNGTYTVTVNTGTGSYTASVTVVVNPAPDITASVDAPFCEGTQDLHLNATSVAATSFSWNGPGGYSSSSEDPIRSNTTASMSGAYEVIATDANGCKDSVTNNVTIYALPPVDVIVIGSNHICTGQTTSDLQASGALTYVWSTSETSDLITISAAGSYTVTGTDVNNCINTDTEVFTESAPPAPPVIVALSDITLCSSDGGATYNPVTLHTTNYTSDLLWSTSETTTDITIDYIDVFNVTYTDGFGCYGVSNSIATIPYYASTTPLNSQVSSDAPGNITCAVPVTLTLAEAAPGDYLADGFLGDNASWVWYDEAGCGVNQVGTGASITITPSAIPGPHNYYVRAEGYCNTTGCASITIIVKEPSTDASSVSGTSTICEGDQTSLTVNGGYLGTGAVWVWYEGGCGNGAALQSSTSTTFDVIPQSPGTHVYFVRAEGDCNTTNCQSISIDVKDSSAQASSATTPDMIICEGATATITANGGHLGRGATWVWYEGSCGGTVLQSSTSPDFAVIPQTIGNHTYFVRAEGDCNTTNCQSVTIFVKDSSEVASSASASPAILCAGDQTTLTVSGGHLGTNASWKWYAGSCGGTLVGIGASINVNTNSTTTYFVRAEGDCNTTNCVSTTVTVRTLSTDPTSASSNAPVNGICIGGSVTLSVAGGSLGTGADWVWYEDGCGNGSPLGTGASLTITPSYEGLHAYYVRAEGPCNETNCAAVSVLVGSYSLDPTSITTSAPGNSICGGNTVTLTVNGGFLGTVAVWKWYSGSCGGTLVGTGPSITLTPAATTTYFVRAEGSCNNSNCASVTVYRSTTPPGNPPPTITSAPNGICSGNGSTLVCHTVSGATYYSWSGPNGTTFGPNNSPSPYITTVPTTTVTFGNLPNGLSGYDICVFAANGCGTSVTKCRYIRGRVQSAQTINGSANSCPNTSSVYSIVSLPGADSYTWTVTGAATINGGVTTLTTTSTSVTVNFLPGFTSGTLSVYGSMSCGYNAPTKTITIISTPVVPGIISGPALVCPLQAYGYSISPVAGATSYIWSTNVPSAVITGSGTSVSVAFPAVIPAGSKVSVVAVGSCGNSAPRDKNIATGLANAPGFISGPTIGQCGQTGVSYSILPVGGATSYLWTVSNGASISGPNNLTGVSVNFPSSFTTSNVSVVAVNSCGNSAPQSKSVTGAPGQAGLITGNQAVCAGAFESYSTSGAANASSYTWTVPFGATILGPTNQDNIIVQWGSAGGNITVYGSNDCGSGAVRSTAVSIICRQAQVDGIGSVNATLYPNPTGGKTTVKFESSQAAKFVISVLDVTGRTITSNEIAASEGINMHELDLSGVAKGIYMVRLQTEGEQAELLKVTVE